MYGLGALRGPLQGQRHSKSGFSGTAINGELSVMRLHDVVGDREAEAETRNLVLDRRAAIKALKHDGPVLVPVFPGHDR